MINNIKTIVYHRTLVEKEKPFIIYRSCLEYQRVMVLVINLIHHCFKLLLCLHIYNSQSINWFCK